MSECTFYVVKSLHIALLGIYYFVIAGVLSYLIELVMPRYDEAEYSKMSFLPFFLELLLYVSLVSLLAYLARNIVERIPCIVCPLYPAFDPSRVKELGGGVIIAFVIFFLQTGFKQKLTKFSLRFMPQ